MARYTKAIDLYKAQIKRFEAESKTRAAGMKMLGEEALADAKELTSGEPDGAARLKILEEERPFARGSSAATSTPSGRRRGGGFGSLPLLPVGKITGKLHDALEVEKLGNL